MLNERDIRATLRGIAIGKAHIKEAFSEQDQLRASWVIDSMEDALNFVLEELSNVSPAYDLLDAAFSEGVKSDEH